MAEPLSVPVTSFQQVFSAKYYCVDPGIRFQEESWRAYWPQLTHSSDCRFCQKVGAPLRARGVQGLEVPSARALVSGIVQLLVIGGEGINVALFDFQALLRRPLTMEVDVAAESSNTRVSFFVKTGSRVWSINFPRECFLSSGCSPHPA